MAVAHYNCDYCNNMIYDEETEEYVCDVDMDEDDYARLLTQSIGNVHIIRVMMNIR